MKKNIQTRIEEDKLIKFDEVRSEHGESRAEAINYLVDLYIAHDGNLDSFEVLPLLKEISVNQAMLNRQLMEINYRLEAAANENTRDSVA